MEISLYNVPIDNLLFTLKHMLYPIPRGSHLTQNPNIPI